MDANHLGAMALLLGAIGVLLLAGLAIVRALLVQRSERALVKALDQRVAAGRAAATRAGQATEDKPVEQPAKGLANWRASAERLGMHWLDTSLGKQLVADEDRQLLEQCGFVEARARGLFLVSRLIGAALLPLLVLPFASGGGRWLFLMLFAIAAGFMVPKLYIRRRAAARRESVADEMPLFVDMLRLLQGVGLSLDQSMQVITHDFKTMLPVLSWELGVAQRQFAAGRTREQSLARLTNSYDNEDLRSIVRLLIQVDKHGGAVQEPLRLFGDRLRDGRRATLRERIGRLTVKMTGVMIVTLLPALLIVTAGPGIMTVVSALANMRR
ncbi:type II secretion system F family protein [Burkholderia gladioli]|uniref:type II secretion system F family protein n=1 Tax=Burkholderia gladioli TaxID=28095 RepID=UPI00164074D1|nr:type II secretion system F family protein [Burkholderia gladioli]